MPRPQASEKSSRDDLTREATLGDQDDLRWLTSDDAAPLLRELLASNEAGLALANRLRKTLSANRARLALLQVSLRRKARAKFTRADELFFERTALEQSTDEWIARHKAARFGSGRVADLCCGIGGDAMQLAAERDLVGVELDPTKALFAEANLRAVGVARLEIRQEDATTSDLSEFAAWHLDPDRRAHGRRVTALADLLPALEVIEALVAQNPHAALKLAPATDPPPRWEREMELEWISRDGECRQLVAWSGDLAREPGRRVATSLAADGSSSCSLVGQPHQPVSVAPLGAFLYEPDPAVLAARLTGEIAARHGLSAVAAGSVYLTSDRHCSDPLLSAFEVGEALPMDRKRLKSALRARGIGRLEIKKRGVDIDPEALRRELDPRGENAATLIVTRVAGRATAILARRADPHDEREPGI